MTDPDFQAIPFHSEFDQRKGWSDADAPPARAIGHIVAPIQAQEQSQKRVSAETCAAALRDIAPHVDAGTAVIRWTGAERCLCRAC